MTDRLLLVDDPAGILACPRCYAALSVDASSRPECGSCGATYAWSDGALDMTPVPPPAGLVSERWALWEELQANGAAAYDADPPSSLAVGDRVDARLFGAFADLRGRVLDVGCGPQHRPSYAPGVDLVGIDPLRGELERGFAFVRGLGEYLPFVDGCFDRVLFGTSIDHLLDPERAIREAVRVLAPGGRVVAWVGLLPDPPPRRLVMDPVEAVIRWARRDPKPAPAPLGAVDEFHFSHPTLGDVEAWLRSAGLVTVERARMSEPTFSAFVSASTPGATEGRSGRASGRAHRGVRRRGGRTS
jgi:SAM-dependent methyltransferase